jgi:hypothetical protein
LLRELSQVPADDPRRGLWQDEQLRGQGNHG